MKQKLDHGERMKQKHVNMYKKIRKEIPQTLRVQLINTYGKICQNCKENEFEHIHHLDGDPSNNQFCNLELLCFTCHKIKHEKRDTLDFSASKILVRLLDRVEECRKKQILVLLDAKGFLCCLPPKK